MGITEFLAGYITAFIDRTGYASVFILMVMESMVLPVPSEAVMPFAGFLIAEGRFSFAGVIAYSTLGSIAGSLISYWLGLHGGKPVIDRWGSYLLLNHRDLELTEGFFKRRGNLAIFISRFIPVIRHLISIPAGIGRMNIVTFSIYTVVGAGLWNTFLTLAGYYLRQHWEVIMQYSRIVDSVVLVVLAVACVWFIRKHLRRASSSA